MKIAIDIGHADGTGARGNGMEEHAVCTVIAGELQPLLAKMGHDARIIDYPSRSNRDDLNSAIAEINDGGYEMAVSLHCDCSDNEAAHGAHVCYVSSAGARCAAMIAQHLTDLLPGRAMSTVYRGNLAILTRTHCVAVLCECGFISHPGDAKIQREQPRSIAAAIAAGIGEFIVTYDR